VLLRVIDWGLALGQPRTLDLVEVRRILEVEVAGLAAERRNEADCEKLASRLAAIEAAVNDASADSYVEADIAFHMELARMAGNSVLADMLQSVRSLLEVWIRRILAVEGVAEENYRFHSRIAEAVIRGDAAAAATAMTEHMRSGEERLRSTLTVDEAAAAADA
jgi:GntR family transcriptional repressor for pyruvate dehydrogenase complex